jgi:hypothetical protein
VCVVNQPVEDAVCQHGVADLPAALGLRQWLHHPIVDHQNFDAGKYEHGMQGYTPTVLRDGGFGHGFLDLLLAMLDLHQDRRHIRVEDRGQVKRDQLGEQQAAYDDQA